MFDNASLIILTGELLLDFNLSGSLNFFLGILLKGSSCITTVVDLDVSLGNFMSCCSSRVGIVVGMVVRERYDVVSTMEIFMIKNFPRHI